MGQHYYFLIADEKFLCSLDGALVKLTESEINNLAFERTAQHAVMVSEDSQTSVLVVNTKIINEHQWLGLRTQLGQVSEEEFQLAGRALQIVRWHFDHQFCGRCGNPTEQHGHDLAKTCIRCALDFYPRLSPCIITLVTRGDYCLLARHARSAQEKYSCLAGFIEAGESPEQTLTREVMEEVNIQVGNIRYFASQPWPFPGQLMLGYFADYEDGDIAVDEDEILAADWFHFENLPKVPPVATLSGRLIDSFVQEKIKQKNQRS